MSDIAELTRRVEALERLHYRSKTVRGWDAAARVLDLTGPTVKRRFKTDPNFPKPSRVQAMRANRSRPEWSLSSLLNYRNQSKA